MIPKSDLYRITALLKNLECNPRETEIYVKSLTIGSSTVQDLANQLGQNRVTVHSAIQQLIQKGLLYETRRGKKRLIAAEEPEVLYKILQRKENELKTLKLNLDYAVRLLENVQNQDRSKPTVKFYEDTDGFKKMLEETLSAKEEVLVFTYVDLFSKLIDPDYLENYFERRAAKGIHTRLIFPPCAFAERVNKKSKEYKIQIRLLPSEWKWKAGIFSWNNVTAIQSFTEGKITCTFIENADISFFYRKMIFELCWQAARPI